MSMEAEPGDVLTIGELADYLRISRSTLYKLAQEGRVPCQKVGRHRRFRKQAIDRWLGARRQRWDESRGRMTRHLLEAVSAKIGHAKSLYHRLVLVAGPEGVGKTRVLRDTAERIGAPLINVSLELSRRLLDVTKRQRPFQVPRLFERIVAETEGDVVLLDNVELLFDVALRQDPLRLLQGLSRGRIVVAAWNGSMEAGHIHYAAPGHPEYRRYPVDSILVAVADPQA